MVTLASTSDHNFKKYLTTREPVDGYSIANIEWSDKVGATKVTISKDGNFATITFNQALLSQAAPNPGVASRAFTPSTPIAPVVTLPVPRLLTPPVHAPEHGFTEIAWWVTRGSTTVDSASRRQWGPFAWVNSAEP